jgi:hypothetical protein
MERSNCKRAIVGCFLCAFTFLNGCSFGMGSRMSAKYERTIQLSAPLAPGSTFAAQTHNGSITIKGADVVDCNLTATIVGQASTDEVARELAEKTQVTLVASDKKLTIKIDKPTTRTNQSVSVSLNGTVPNKTDLELLTHNGGIEIANVTGRAGAATHNGKITAENISGTVVLETHNGSVNCMDVSGDAQLKTHNGGVKVSYSQAATEVRAISAITHNGSVEFAAPPGFSAQVEASTHNGSVHTDLPVTVVGKVSKNELKGTIGAGQGGKLHLETYNGSIRIR